MTATSSGSPATPSIDQLVFGVVHRSRPFDLVAPGFEVEPDTWADPSPEGLRLSSSGPAAPYASVVVPVSSPSQPTAAGLATPNGDHVVARWSPDKSRLTIESRQGGRTNVLRRKKMVPEQPFDLAFALCENQVSVLVDTGGGWRPVLTERNQILRTLDLREAELLRRYRYAWAGAPADATAVRAGLFGHTGLRDPHLVEHADGRPFTRHGRYFMTWTCAGLGFFPQAHWSVWSFQPSAPDRIQLEAKLFADRDGLLLGDHAGHIVRDGDRWHVVVSSWGDFPNKRIHVRHLSTETDVLSGVHLLKSEPTPLPSRHGTWDPGLIKVDDAWHVSFVESESQSPFDFHPALATTREEEWTSALDRVPLQGAFRQCEGPVFARVGQRTWLLASDAHAREYPIFALDGTRAGRLEAPYPTNIPHPQLVPDPGGGWFLVTFDGTPYAAKVLGYGGHGDVVVMHTE
jgi:hypothetical protein